MTSNGKKTAGQTRLEISRFPPQQHVLLPDDTIIKVEAASQSRENSIEGSPQKWGNPGAGGREGSDFFETWSLQNIPNIIMAIKVAVMEVEEAKEEHERLEEASRAFLKLWNIYTMAGGDPNALSRWYARAQMVIDTCGEESWLDWAERLMPAQAKEKAKREAAAAAETESTKRVLIADNVANERMQCTLRHYWAPQTAGERNTGESSKTVVVEDDGSDVEEGLAPAAAREEVEVGESVQMLRGSPLFPDNVVGQRVDEGEGEGDEEIPYTNVQGKRRPAANDEEGRGATEMRSEKRQRMEDNDNDNEGGDRGKRARVEAPKKCLACIQRQVPCISVPGMKRCDECARRKKGCFMPGDRPEPKKKVKATTKEAKGATKETGATAATTTTTTTTQPNLQDLPRAQAGPTRLGARTRQAAKKVTRTIESSFDVTMGAMEAKAALNVMRRALQIHEKEMHAQLRLVDWFRHEVRTLEDLITDIQRQNRESGEEWGAERMDDDETDQLEFDG